MDWANKSLGYIIFLGSKQRQYHTEEFAGLQNIIFNFLF